MELQDFLSENLFISFPEVFDKLQNKELSITDIMNMCIVEDERIQSQKKFEDQFEGYEPDDELLAIFKEDRSYLDGDVPFFVRFLRDEEGFKVILSANLATKEDLINICDKVVEKSEAAQFTYNSFLLTVMLLTNTISFREFIGNLRKTNQLPYILTNDEFFKTLDKSDLLDLKNLTTLWNATDPKDTTSLRPNVWLTQKLLEENITDFRTLVNRFKNKGKLQYFMRNEELFKELLKTQTISDDDIKYLLKQLETKEEILGLCEYSDGLAKHVLKNFLLDVDLLTQYNVALKDHTVFYHLDFYAKTDYVTYDEIESRRVFKYKEEENIDKELIDLISLNRVMHCFELTHEAKKELFNFILNNEGTLNILTTLVESHLKSSFDNAEDVKLYLSMRKNLKFDKVAV